MGLFDNAPLIKVISVWLAALCTLGIYSVLYKENKVFRFFEHLFIGLATGYTIYTTWNDVLKPRWWEPMTTKGMWWWAFAVPAGLLFYFIYSKKHAWLSRLIFGLFFGAAAGRAFQGFAAFYFPQIRAAVNMPLLNPPEAAAPTAYFLTPFSAVLNNLLFLAILVSVMTYFFFSFEQKGKITPAIARIGRFLLMFAFGAIFGSTIMARMSLLIGRIHFLIHDWIQGVLLNRTG
ncbi:MAG: hypothetical protein SFU56_17175 [Capsulimonadales bacterium]|nr:hypothetical protein [Capsulimonadales bacterium]